MTTHPTPRWRRKGMVYPVKPGAWWATHAQIPTVLVLSPQLWRIYFAGRDRNNRGAMLAVDVDPTDNMRVVAEHLTPLLEARADGMFDSMGVGPSCALWVGDEIYLYYTGIFQRRDVPFQMGIGLAVSRDGLSFERKCAGPILSTGPMDPYYTALPCVVPGPDGFRMWYVSATGWDPDDGEAAYGIRTTTSRDGVFWSQDTQPVLGPDGADVALTRPWVLEGAGGPTLWYSRRGRDFRNPGPDAYALASCPLWADGRARSAGHRLAFEAPPVPGAFDDVMQAYGSVMPWQDTQVLFYNGNDFGQAGIGWAVLQTG